MIEKGLRDIELRVLSELMKNSKRSDRELASLLRVSQPTVTRVRAKLEKEGYIREYTVIPNFTKIGYDILALTLVKLKEKPSRQQIGEMQKRARQLEKTIAPNCILSISMLGLQYDSVLASLHRTYEDYLQFKQQIIDFSPSNIESIEPILVSLTGNPAYRSLTFSTLGEHILKTRMKTSE